MLLIAKIVLLEEKFNSMSKSMILLIGGSLESP